MKCFVKKPRIRKDLDVTRTCPGRGSAHGLPGPLPGSSNSWTPLSTVTFDAPGCLFKETCNGHVFSCAALARVQSFAGECFQYPLFLMPEILCSLCKETTKPKADRSHPVAGRKSERGERGKHVRYKTERGGIYRDLHRLRAPHQVS